MKLEGESKFIGKRGYITTQDSINDLFTHGVIQAKGTQKR